MHMAGTSAGDWRRLGHCHPSLPHRVLPAWLQVNLATGEGLDESLQALTADGLQLVAVINCAAISQPAVCERDPAAAAAVNVPTHLLDALDRHQQRQLSSSASSSSSSSTQQPLLIHISSDQVYDGSRAWWREGDVCRPINTYGRTKLAAEQLIQQRCPHHAILRSSIIYGPQPRVPVGRTLFLQFVDQALASKVCGVVVWQGGLMAGAVCDSLCYAAHAASC